jgi:hypothetical protein
MTTNAAINAGDLVIVAFAAQGTTSGVSLTSVTDGTNTYSLVGGVSNGTSIDTELWVSPNSQAAGSGVTITAHISSATGVGAGQNVQAAAVSGMNATLTDVNDGPTLHSSIVTASTSTSTATGALKQGAELIVGQSLVSVSTASETQASGFANIVTSSAGALDKFALDYQIVNSAASVPYNPTWSLSGTISQIVIGLRGATFDMTAQSIMG